MMSDSELFGGLEFGPVVLALTLLGFLLFPL